MRTTIGMMPLRCWAPHAVICASSGEGANTLWGVPVFMIEGSETAALKNSPRGAKLPTPKKRKDE